ncbi:hypothetical protein [Oceanobacillus timonensis]|uniref:hypothetical protein n=1 Tax=Oceanobacillus timonensis TaxID=1926285 RepID=UPI00117F86F9|nr:hypothetical protein [Oceanobacillus timonensis]
MTIVTEIINPVTVAADMKAIADAEADMKNVVIAEIITATIIITNVVNRIIVITDSVIEIEGDSAFVVTASTNKSI